MPVFGSPTMATSGTTRPGVPQRLARSLPTTPCWYDGSAKSRLVPPPPPYWKTGGPHALPASGAFSVPQPVSPTVAVGLADSQRRAADRGDPRARRRPVDRGDPEVRD